MHTIEEGLLDDVIIDEGKAGAAPAVVEKVARKRPGHSEAMRRRWQEPGYRQRLTPRMSAAALKRSQNPEYRRRLSEGTRKGWENPERRRRAGETQREVWENSELLRHHSDTLREVWQRPGRRQRASELSQDPEYRRRLSAGVREAWQRDPELRARVNEAIREAWQDPERRIRHSEAMREMWQDPELRIRRSELSREMWQDLTLRERRRKSFIRHYDLVALGRKLSEAAGLEPAPDDELAELAEIFLKEIGEEI
jgi:hypothetical protein